MGATFFLVILIQYSVIWCAKTHKKSIRVLRPTRFFLTHNLYVSTQTLSYIYIKWRACRESGGLDLYHFHLHKMPQYNAGGVATKTKALSTLLNVTLQLFRSVIVSLMQCKCEAINFFQMYIRLPFPGTVTLGCHTKNDAFCIYIKYACIFSFDFYFSDH